VTEETGSEASDRRPLDPEEPEIACEDLKRRIAAGEDLYLLDVREPHEVAIVRLDGAVEMPLAGLPARLGELPHDRPIVTICHLGGRSWQAMAFLRARGFSQSWSLAGGIHEWALRIDRSLRTY